MEISSEDIPGWIVANKDILTVALDISISPELVSEGNARVLVNPVKSPTVVHSRNRVVAAIDEFDRPLGIERAGQPLSARRWLEAATDVAAGALDAATQVTDKALGTATEGADAAMRLGNETRDRALLATSEFASRIADRALRMRAHDGDHAEEG